MDTAARQPLLKVEHLKQYFKVNKTFTVKAVDDISFEIFPGETYGLVGESGSGKSTTGRSIIRLYDPTGGTIIFNGENITGRLTAAQTKMLRTKMQMIFQDPMASLNPREKVIDIIAQGLAQVVNLMKDIQKETGCAYLFIAHDLSMVKYISDRIGVLHLGHLVETGSKEEIFENPVHPYTKSLLSAIPHTNPRVEKQRKAVGYDYAKSGIRYENGTRRLVGGTHYVLATDEEFAAWTAQKGTEEQ